MTRTSTLILFTAEVRRDMVTRMSVLECRGLCGNFALGVRETNV